MNRRLAVPALVIAGALLLGGAKCSTLPTTSQQTAVTGGGGLVVYRGLNPPLQGKGVWARGADGRWIFTSLLIASAAAAAAGDISARIAGAGVNGRVFNGPIADNPCYRKPGTYRVTEWMNHLGKRVFLTCTTYRKIFGKGQPRTHLSNFYKCVYRVLIWGSSADGAVWRLTLHGGTTSVFTVERYDGSFKITDASSSDGWASCARGT
jgi:hypothetical protein